MPCWPGPCCTRKPPARRSGGGGTGVGDARPWGATFAEVLAPLATVAGLRATANADGVLRALHGSDGAVLVVAVDALDEVSTDVDRREIVKLLVGLARLPRLRVVVAEARQC